MPDAKQEVEPTYLNRMTNRKQTNLNLLLKNEAFIHALQLGAVDAWTFFTTVDVDGDFEVSVDEFTERCLQLHGPAKSVDLFAVKMQNAPW